MRPLLIPVDYTAVTGAQLEQGRQLAAALGAPIYLLHVEPPEPDFVGYEPGPQHVRDEAANDALEHHAELRELRDGLRTQGVEAHALVIQGPAAEKILSEAERLNVAMIIVGSHGHGVLHQWLAGDVGAAVSRKARHPVLVVPEP